jgi:hypothetical protein
MSQTTSIAEELQRIHPHWFRPAGGDDDQPEKGRQQG